MENVIDGFISYLHKVKNTSTNTELSYKRDLKKVVVFMQQNGISDFSQVTKEDLIAYKNEMEENHFAAASISRTVASLKALYHYMCQEGIVSEDISDVLKAPKIEKKMPEILTTQEVECLLEQPAGASSKEIRDKAMLELLYATGIRVTELINLKISEVNIPMSFILCRDANKERVIPFGTAAKSALVILYLPIFLAHSLRFLLNSNLIIKKQRIITSYPL